MRRLKRLATCKWFPEKSVKCSKLVAEHEVGKSYLLWAKVLEAQRHNTKRVIGAIRIER